MENTNECRFYITQNEIAETFNLTSQAICINAKNIGANSFRSKDTGMRAAFSPSEARKIFEYTCYRDTCWCCKTIRCT